MKFFEKPKIETIESADFRPIVLLLKFRSLMSNPTIQFWVPVAYQIYLALCLAGGFYFRKEILYVGAAFVVLDVLTYVASMVKQSMVFGQVMCALNILISAGISGQSVFAKRFPSIGGSVSGVVADVGINTVVGLILAAAVAGVCIALRKFIWSNADTKSKAGGLTILSYIFLGGFAVLCVVFACMGQWIRIGPFSVQPGEYMKVVFLFYISFVSGASDKEMSFLKKMILELIAFAAICAYFVLQSEFGSILVILAVFIFFLLISHRNWIAIVAILLVVCLIAGLAFSVIIGLGNTYIEEKYGEEQVDEFEEQLNAESSAGTAEESELTGGNEAQEEKKNLFVGREYGKVTGKIVSLFTSNYEKIYMRYMVVKDIDGTDPDTLPGVREVLRTQYSFQASAALDAIGISRFFPFNAPIFNYVPVGASDYIYTSVLQCGGLASVIVMLFAYLLLADSAFALITTNCHAFSRNLVFVMISSILIQMFINVLGVNNLIPLTGITLPFVSSGGSSFSACIMMIGCMIWADIDYFRQKEKSRMQWENSEQVKGGVLVNESAEFRFE